MILSTYFWGKRKEEMLTGGVQEEGRSKDFKQKYQIWRHKNSAPEIQFLSDMRVDLDGVNSVIHFKFCITFLI
jgi:hypothetical protein